MLLIAALFLVQSATAVLIDFENCLTGSVQNEPLNLQLVPKFFDAVFNTSAPSHNLNITVYYNVTGSVDLSTHLPSPDNSSYWNSNLTEEGKLTNVIIGPSATELFAKYDVVTYTPWSEKFFFCDEPGSLSAGAACPVSPVFKSNV
jgi:ML-like domain